MARVVVVAAYVPRFPSSGSPSRDFYILKHLALHHEIVLVAPETGLSNDTSQCVPNLAEVRLAAANGPAARSRRFRASFGSPTVAHRLARLQHIVREPPFEVMVLEDLTHNLGQELRKLEWTNVDLLHISQSLLAPLRVMAPQQMGSVLDCHNAHSSIALRNLEHVTGWRHRIAEWTEWRKLRAFESAALAPFDAWLACSEIDRIRLSQLQPKCNPIVVPNGVDTEYFAPDRELETAVEPHSMVFTGVMNYEPNIRGIVAFCEKCLPVILDRYPNARLYIVGRNPAETILALEKRWPNAVVITHGVPDVRPYLRRAQVAIVPLLNGGGTRLKVLEMLAMGMATVSTPVGSEGLDLIAGSHLLVEELTEGFAATILRLFDSPELRSRLGAAGRTAVQSKYDWARIAPLVATVWDELLRSRHHS